MALKPTKNQEKKKNVKKNSLNNQNKHKRADAEVSIKIVYAGICI